MARKKKLSTAEICAELKKLRAFTVNKIDTLYLDPNNPRLFYSGKTLVPDRDITKKTIQERYLEEIRDGIGIIDLVKSIETSGFTSIDRIVVRPIKGHPGKHVLVEGNRRVTALRTMADEHEDYTHRLHSDVLKTFKDIDALIYEGDNPMIAWIIQSFRHSIGIEKWEKYPLASFLVRFEKESGLPAASIPGIFGMKSKNVSRLIRSWYGFEDAKKDPDYGQELEPEHFGHFDLVIFAEPSIWRDWLRWEGRKKTFTNRDGLNFYLKAAIDKEEPPHITISPKTRDVLGKLVLPENRDLLYDLKEGRLTLDECDKKLTKDELETFPEDITKTLKQINKITAILERLPLPSIRKASTPEDIGNKKQLLILLKQLSDVALEQIALINK